LNLFLDDENFAETSTPEPGTTAIIHEGDTPIRTFKLKTPSPAQADDAEVTPEEDEKKEQIARAMKLLLAARDRVLTLTEQRLLAPTIPSLTSPPMITSMDLPSIVANNPNLAYQLFLALLIAANAQPQGPYPYLDVLTRLPPTLPSFDLLVRLLQDTSIVIDPATGGKTTVADVVRIEVLGRFIHGSIKWLDNAEREEQEGLISDDRVGKGIQNLCRFYASLLRLSVVDVALDADTAEMAHFTLRHSRFEEANTLYRLLAAGRF